MTYARAIRLSLAESRTRGLDFSSAWDLAMEEHPVPEPERRSPEAYGADAITGQGGSWNDVLPFLKRTMKAAYERKPLRAGQNPTLIVPLSESAEDRTGRYVRSQGGRTSLERTAVQIG